MSVGGSFINSERATPKGNHRQYRKGIKPPLVIRDIPLLECEVPEYLLKKLFKAKCHDLLLPLH